MFNTIKNSLKNPDIRKRLLYTLLLIILFRLGCYITVPGVNTIALREQMDSITSGFVDMIDLISGGAFSNLSIFALTIGPYITASIVIQLLTKVFPAWERMIKEGGEEGRKKLNFYTKIFTIVLAVVQSIPVYLNYKNAGVFVDNGPMTGFLVILSLVTGTALLTWLGEQITEKGIGNGISMIIFTGIISGLPTGLTTIWKLVTANGFSTEGIILSLAIIVGAIALVAGVVFVNLAERRINITYAKKVVGRKMVGANSSHIPLKLVMSGVMPIIYASTIMTVPATIIYLICPTIETQTGFWGQFFAGMYKLSIATSSANVPVGYTIANAIIYLGFIFAFTFAATYMEFNPAEVASNIKKNGGYVPGIRPGKPTEEYLKQVLNKLLWFGGLFLAVIAILPMMMRFTGLNLTFGGTSILIVVSVALEVIKQLESQLVMRNYKGFLDK